MHVTFVVCTNVTHCHVQYSSKNKQKNLLDICHSMGGAHEVTLFSFAKWKEWLHVGQMSFIMWATFDY